MCQSPVCPPKSCMWQAQPTKKEICSDKFCCLRFAISVHSHVNEPQMHDCTLIVAPCHTLTNHCIQMQYNVFIFVHPTVTTCMYYVDMNYVDNINNINAIQ